MRVSSLVASLLSVIVVSGNAIAANDEVTLLVPAFAGTGLLGKNVGTVLNLQIWQTLRKAPYPNPERLDFGQGRILWSDSTLAVSDHMSAEIRGSELRTLAQGVLWGRTWVFGDGVVVQAHLSLPAYEDFRTSHHEKWTIPVSCGRARTSIQVDLPRRRYEFDPIVLSLDFVERLSSPAALDIFTDQSLSKRVGSVGESFTALEHSGDYVQVKSGDVYGWVHLPRLSAERTEVVDFTGAVIRIFRADWQGAEELLSRVLANPRLSTDLGIHSHLLRAMARERMGKSGRTDTEQALARNPYDRSAAMFHSMVILSELEKHRTKPQRTEELRRELANFLTEKRFLFGAEDPWFDQVLLLVNSKC